eukprot:TRINITY_DN19570_c0_g1_i1.p1 TRINITY_DN19570_c0_g1~~TRINITY_DN19570_c0_g1_i1.p1  ORF type:complete len:347 (+),score=75.60 TRINITY_DN19570_c0_g1_i1:83-1123(+)
MAVQGDSFRDAAELTIAYGTISHKFVLFDGADSNSLHKAVEGRFGLAGFNWYLTLPGKHGVVPLNAALPDQITLSLHVIVGHHHGGHHHHGSYHRHGSFPQAGKERRAASPTSMAAGGRSLIATAAQSGQGVQAAIDESGLPMPPPAPEPHKVTELPSDATSSGGNAVPLLREAVESCEVQQSASSSMTTEELELSNRSSRCSGQQRRGSFEGTFMSMHDEQLDRAVASVDRLSRLASDLANERTYLAWVRTGLAAIRTCFAYLGVAAMTDEFDFSVVVATFLMTAVVIVAAISGGLRYSRVKAALMSPEPPEHFGRVSLHWFNAVALTSMLATAAGMYSRDWTKA